MKTPDNLFKNHRNLVAIIQYAVWLYFVFPRRIADKRREFHYEQAHQLCKDYDVLVFEDLKIDHTRLIRTVS